MPLFFLSSPKPLGSPCHTDAIEIPDFLWPLCLVLLPTPLDHADPCPASCLPANVSLCSACPMQGPGAFVPPIKAVHSPTLQLSAASDRAGAAVPQA
ncbi:hypothetical protein TRIATDRAFT_291314 [Trichoderma atroviride IMI 206040]|uniref:Uncharacterized protein n=1 Tax=Hypocrea atroviridis (strain ATCC 20476 / IMI 206040) TaxID=452589 RepID=G9NPU3_HYPAI|nr:uncharacterized protein TRIATDRAFT_291314 [Trichoderma atroviride IMI 206040]EHK47096.1 hypothetical protein TRIATDRAFT_291314 [Trichoderma atroviride IMI 206040]